MACIIVIVNTLVCGVSDSKNVSWFSKANMVVCGSCRMVVYGVLCDSYKNGSLWCSLW